MKFHGDISLLQNELSEAVIKLDTDFPQSPKVGQLVFKHKVLYICLSIDNDTPIWCPLTKEITSHTHIQSVAASDWTINHQLNTSDVSITVYDINNYVVQTGDIVVVDDNTITINVGTAAVGKVVVISGYTHGVQAPTYAFEHFQTSPSATWTIVHGLNRYPVIRIFVGTSEVQPSSITFPSMNVAEVTFSSPMTGYAKLV